MKRTLIISAVFLALTATACYTRYSWLPAIGRWLDVGEMPQQVDYVLSLPGDEDYRPFMAAAMIKAGIAKQALIVQNEPSPEVEDGVALPTSEVIRRVYEYCEVPASQLTILSGRSTSTSTDMEILAEFLKEHSAARVAVVTSNYHTRRSRWTLRNQLGRTANQLVIVSAPNGDCDLEYWWRTEDGFLLFALEYVKFSAYLVLYGRAWLLLAVGAAALLAWRWNRRLRP